MEKLRFNNYSTKITDDLISFFASCINKVEELYFNSTDNVTANGWNILATALINRPTSVSLQKNSSSIA